MAGRHPVLMTTLKLESHKVLKQFAHCLTKQVPNNEFTVTNRTSVRISVFSDNKLELIHW